MPEVSTRKLVYDFRRKYNSVNSGANKDLQLPDIIAFLNEAQAHWFKNQLRLAQKNQEIANNLRRFLRSDVALDFESLDGEKVLAKYPKGLYRRLNQVVVASKDCCKDIVKRIVPRPVESDDLHEARRNPVRRADFFFEQLPFVVHSDGILLYHDGEMDIDKVTIDYYRTPRELHAPSLEECAPSYYYDYQGRIITKDQNFEAGDTFAENDVTDLAVLFAMRDTMDFQGYQTQLNKILQLPQLGIDR